MSEGAIDVGEGEFPGLGGEGLEGQLNDYKMKEDDFVKMECLIFHY